MMFTGDDNVLHVQIHQAFVRFVNLHSQALLCCSFFMACSIVLASGSLALNCTAELQSSDTFCL